MITQRQNQDGQVGRPELHSPMNTPKLQPHTKQLSFRENDLKPAEHPLYNQHRERTTLRKAGAEKKGSSQGPLARYSQTEGSSQTGAFCLRRLQSVWCSGQHLETMPSIGCGSQPTELQTGDSLQPIPPPTHTDTQGEAKVWL